MNSGNKEIDMPTVLESLSVDLIVAKANLEVAKSEATTARSEIKRIKKALKAALKDIEQTEECRNIAACRLPAGALCHACGDRGSYVHEGFRYCFTCFDEIANGRIHNSNIDIMYGCKNKSDGWTKQDQINEVIESMYLPDTRRQGVRHERECPACSEPEEQESECDDETST